MRRLALCITLIAALSGSVVATEQFKDVPKDHWAADSVKMLAEAGIVKGYSDSTYKGDKPVTRYELAVALANFVQFIEQSRKPIETGKPAASSEKKETKQDNPGEKAMAYLKDGGFLPANSALLRDGGKVVTARELSEAMASIATELIERNVPSQQPGAEDTPKSGK